MNWTPWLREARDAMKFWGYRRVPTDFYREQFAVGNTPEQAAKQWSLRAGCDTCPHVDYLTTNVETSEHQCSSCGATFIDAAREKRYFGKGPRATAPKG